MGAKGGQPPLPTKLKMVRGDRNSRIPKNEPQPDSLRLRAPKPLAWMSADAKRVWSSLAKQLWQLGVLTEVDYDSFAVFCEAVVHHRQACRLVDASAVLVADQHGNLRKNPALQVVRDSASILRGMAQEFGLTPSARAGIVLPESADFDEARRLLS